MTTNGTLVTEEVVDFWKRWGMGFHTSIDGTPEIQDQNRPTTGGKGSSRLVGQAVPKNSCVQAADDRQKHRRACERG
jgi:uncharacterized protein